MKRTGYDLVIVGSGIACSMTLCELAERMKARPVSSKMLRIAIIERDSEMWNGVPYGRRSAVGALTFQRLQEFLDEPERESYIKWLSANSDRWVKDFLQYGGPGATQWLADNQPLMERGEWGELYLPRFLFGWYVSSRVDRALKDLASNGAAQIDSIHGEAISVCRMPAGRYEIAVEHGGARWWIDAEKVVLAIGSPPQKSIHDSVSAEGHIHIDDVYSPFEDHNIHRIQETLSSLPDKKMANVLIVGSNASSLEVLYIFNYCSEIRKRLNSAVVLSRSGLLPYKICQEQIEFKLKALDSLCGSRAFSAFDLMAAISSDVKRAEELRHNIADLRDPIGEAVSKLLALLSVTEQKEFVCEYGIHYSRMMRRAGRDTRNAADELVNDGILTTVKGNFIRLEPSASGKGLASAVYATEGNSEVTHPLPFSITINCGGFEELNPSSSRIIKSVINNGICRLNSTNRGFLLNKKLEASENVYVIGPLVAGNFNESFRYWHVESALRIAGLAKTLAEALYESLLPSSDYIVPDQTGLSTMNLEPASS